jgi:hypothetical protein
MTIRLVGAWTLNGNAVNVNAVASRILIVLRKYAIAERVFRDIRNQ